MDIKTIGEALDVVEQLGITFSTPDAVFCDRFVSVEDIKYIAEHGRREFFAKEYNVPATELEQFVRDERRRQTGMLEP